MERVDDETLIPEAKPMTTEGRTGTASEYPQDRSDDGEGAAAKGQATQLLHCLQKPNSHRRHRHSIQQ